MLVGLFLSTALLAVPAPPVHGDVHQRIARLDAMLLDEPDDAGLLLRRAELHREDGNWTAAAADLARAAEKHPELEGLDVEAALLAAASGRAPIQLRPPGSPYAGPAPVARGTAALVAPGAEWRYRDNGISPPVTWKQQAYNDSSWAFGPSELGYGDGDEATVVSFGPNPDQKYPTTWFRHRFSVTGGVPPEAALAMIVDDGAIAYLNGVEIARLNLPAGQVSSGTYATTGVSGSGEVTWNWFAIPPGVLSNGQNLLAIEVHQASPTSSDLSLDVALIPEAPPQLVRGPWIQAVASDAATLCWRSMATTDAVVWWGTAPGQLTQSVTVAGPAKNQEVRISGLPAGSTIYYAIGDSGGVFVGDDAEHRFRTAPAPGTHAPLRAWVIGDSGERGPEQAAVRDAFLAWETQNGEVDMMIQLGDNAYPDGNDDDYQLAFFDPYGDLLRRLPVWSTRGNHDLDGPAYDRIYAPPTAAECGGVPSGTEAYYSFDWGENVHFVCLDSFASDRHGNSAMAQWLEADLAASDALWTIAYFHHPPYTRGGHDSDDRLDSGGRLVEVRMALLPILERHGVDLVLSGHSHSYERSMLLQGHYGFSWGLLPRHQVDKGDGREFGDGVYRNTTRGLSGTVYAVCGSSSHISGNGSLDHPVMIQSELTLGSLILEVAGDRLDLRFLDDLGNERDHVTLKTRRAVPLLCVGSAIAGAPMRMEVQDLRPSAPVWVYGSSSRGMAPVAQGISGLAAPVTLIAGGIADTRGRFPLIVYVPAGTSGVSRSFQPVEELASGDFVFGDPVDVVIQ